MKDNQLLIKPHILKRNTSGRHVIMFKGGAVDLTQQNKIQQFYVCTYICFD